MQLRFLFDEDLSAVGQLIAKARDDTNYIGQPGFPVAKETADEVWLPYAASEGFTVIRKDTDALRANTAEHRAWMKNGNKGFVLRLHNATIWKQLHVLVHAWPGMEQHALVRSSDRAWIAKINADFRVKPVV